MNKNKLIHVFFYFPIFEICGSASYLFPLFYSILILLFFPQAIYLPFFCIFFAFPFSHFFISFVGFLVLPLFSFAFLSFILFTLYFTIIFFNQFSSFILHFCYFLFLHFFISLFGDFWFCLLFISFILFPLYFAIFKKK